MANKPLLEFSDELKNPLRRYLQIIICLKPGHLNMILNKKVSAYMPMMQELMSTFWITDDSSSNKNPQNGGLIVWKKHLI